ncbi:conserved protein [Tepidicaulis marinus]|uniref:Conserved protein n=1 Tax=Tepidicaulis marinus TaxID=1333998 RepID=A0A081BAS7_9HYPH|nr:conserved protein [Tepidicaulis marinus]
MSGTPEQDWAAIKRAWAEDKLTPKEIAAAYGLSYQKLSARARAEGWRKGESGREGNAEKQRRRPPRRKARVISSAKGRAENGRARKESSPGSTPGSGGFLSRRKAGAPLLRMKA